MAQWYEMINSLMITINFCYAKKMNCALMFIISNLTQRLTVAIQQGNAASIFGTVKVDSADEEFFV